MVEEEENGESGMVIVGSAHLDRNSAGSNHECSSGEWFSVR